MIEMTRKEGSKMIRFVFDLLFSPIQTLIERIAPLFDGAMSKSPQNDPTYKKNVQRLIERNREFEKRP
ncbi:hypothetical protein CIW50_09200 [Tardiphaga sp. P9-11]|nr:hypothetical protein CIW50_09200 [Tardiphaga sp. P9-11]